MLAKIVWGVGMGVWVAGVCGGCEEWIDGVGVCVARWMWGGLGGKCVCVQVGKCGMGGVCVLGLCVCGSEGWGLGCGEGVDGVRMEGLGLRDRGEGGMGVGAALRRHGDLGVGQRWFEGTG